MEVLRGRSTVGGTYEKFHKYYLEDELLSHYSYLNKYPKWQNLFKNIEDSVLYRIEFNNLEWLEKK
jgi:hypothetical protein